MSPTPDAIIRQWFNEVWNEGREDTIDRLFHPAGTSEGLAAEPIRGPDQFKAFARRLRGAFSDIRIEVMRTIVQGDLVAAHCRMTGHHTGDALGAAATGRPVELTGMSMARVQDGRIVEAWNSYDFLALYQQLGWVKNPPLP